MRQTYSINYQQKEQATQQLTLTPTCKRCEKAIDKHTRTAFNHGLGTERISYCNDCLQREFYLLAKVRDCIRVLGGVSMHEIIRLYDDETAYGELRFDPFKEARVLYKGDQRLLLADIHKWVKEGIIHKRVVN